MVLSTELIMEIRSDEGLTLEIPAFESLYGGEFTLSTQSIKPNYLVNTPHRRSTTVSLETYTLYSFEVKDREFNLISTFIDGGQTIRTVSM